MKIYTKTGDEGMTSLVGGKRVKKCCARLDSYGSVDELNSFIGLLVTYITDEADIAFLQKIQGELFMVGGSLATDLSVSEARCEVTQAMISDIESEIDRLSAALPPLRSFVVPGGSRAAALAHVCRTVCRRAERCVFALIEEGGAVEENVAVYLNRLSDYFFVMARKNVDG
ncbi:MAG: cob(I)yrinic acid a,c-diamide adenosyltransferase [Prevotella sp.]|nr:cob(I)yrinic acid a,c-diamide adenosyltransferase [Prevotella sp.]